MGWNFLDHNGERWSFSHLFSFLMSICVHGIDRVQSLAHIQHHSRNLHSTSVVKCARGPRGEASEAKNLFFHHHPHLITRYCISMHLLDGRNWLNWLCVKFKGAVTDPPPFPPNKMKSLDKWHNIRKTPKVLLFWGSNYLESIFLASCLFTSQAPSRNLKNYAITTS